jgi:hypothetical protein
MYDIRTMFVCSITSVHCQMLFNFYFILLLRHCNVFSHFFMAQPHTDGPLYHPTVTTVSLGDHIVLDYYRPLDAASSSSEPDMKHVSNECCSEQSNTAVC